MCFLTHSCMCSTVLNKHPQSCSCVCSRARVCACVSCSCRQHALQDRSFPACVCVCVCVCVPHAAIMLHRLGHAAEAHLQYKQYTELYEGMSEGAKNADPDLIEQAQLLKQALGT